MNMARILICHVAKDAPAARDLGAALMARGNAVTFDGEPQAERSGRAARLSQFEVVIVIWSESSVASEPLAELAREALEPNLLLPVRLDEVLPAGLPPRLRRLNSFVAGDIAGICRNVARLATAAASTRELARSQGLGRLEAKAEPRAATVQAVSATSDLRHVPETGAGLLIRYEVPMPAEGRPELEAESEPQLAAPAEAGEPAVPAEKWVDLEAGRHALEIAAGHLMHLIPGEMWLGEAETVVIWLDGGLREELGPVADGELEEGLLPVVERMSLDLLADAAAFDILLLTEAVQEVGPGASPARWEWQVVPRASGTHSFRIRISGIARDAEGRPSAPALADQELRVSVCAPVVAEAPLWPKISSLWQRLRRSA